MKKAIAVFFSVLGFSVVGIAAPNVVLIFADDLGYGDVGFNGCSDIPTPALDQLAEDGVVCAKTYASHPYCGPSRAGIMTGRWQQRFGNVINPPFAPAHENIGLAAGEKTMADYLKKAGYTTGLIGKWHLGSSAPMHPMSRGFDSFFGFLGGGRDYFPEKYPSEDALWNGSNVYFFYKLPLQRNRSLIPPPEGYMTDILTEEAVSFIDENKEHPFLLCLAYNAPHTPLQAKEVDLARFSHITDKKRRTYAAMVSCLDQGVGRVLDALEAHGLRDDTLVIFTSDNGGKEPWSSSGPLRGGKGSPYEGGTRVPLVLSWPGQLEAGRVYNGTVSLLDLVPTFLAMAGQEVDPNHPLDGVDLIPFLQGTPTGQPHEWLYAKRYYRADPESGVWSFQRNGMKLVMPKPGKVPELYDLTVDPSEKNNVLEANPEQASELEQQCRQFECFHTVPVWGWSEEGSGLDVREKFLKESRAAFEGEVNDMP